MLAGPGKQPPGRVGTPMTPPTAQDLGSGQCPLGLDPRDIGLGLYLHTSGCLISLASENQDGGESLLTGGRQISDVASVG